MLHGHVDSAFTVDGGNYWVQILACITSCKPMGEYNLSLLIIYAYIFYGGDILSFHMFEPRMITLKHNIFIA